jgi:hypothetical protein
MKTTTKNQCCAGNSPTGARSRGAQCENCIRSHIKAACAARAEAARMTLEDWREVESEVQQRLQYECHAKKS